MRGLHILLYAFAITSCAINSASGNEGISRSISIFERDVTLPEGSASIEKYARFYKILKISSSNMPDDNVSIVHFRYIQRNMQPGVYIVTDPDDLPDDPLTDGGCLSIDGFFRLSDGKMINLECAPQR